MFDVDQVVIALRDELGIGPVVRVEPVEQGSFNVVFRAVLADRRLYVRINRDREAYPREVGAYRRAAACGMPIPEIVGYLIAAIKVLWSYRNGDLAAAKRRVAVLDALMTDPGA